MYKVFFKDSYFLLTDKQNFLETQSHFWIHEDVHSTQTFILNLLNQQIPFRAILYSKDLEELYSVFKSCFFYVRAAGGVVLQKNQILLIKRFGMYDLPKGHIEPNESIENCAIREVEEECGLQQVKIIETLPATLHIYPMEKKWFLKKTDWFTMNCPLGINLTPQKEEGIEEAFWFPLANLAEIKPHTYPSLAELLDKLPPTL